MPRILQTFTYLYKQTVSLLDLAFCLEHFIFILIPMSSEQWRIFKLTILMEYMVCHEQYK